MRRTSVGALAVAVCCLGGCCGSQENRDIERIGQPVARPAPVRTALAAGLLFDRRPGPYDATEFAIRGDWPSTVSFWSPGQMIYARERLIDVQGPRSGGHSYQRFHTERVMIGHR